jgi:hypothetical protein
MTNTASTQRNCVRKKQRHRGKMHYAACILKYSISITGLVNNSPNKVMELTTKKN